MSAPTPPSADRPKSGPSPNAGRTDANQFDEPAPVPFADTRSLLLGLVGFGMLFYFLLWDLIRGELERQYGWRVHKQFWLHAKDLGEVDWTRVYEEVRAKGWDGFYEWGFGAGQAAKVWVKSAFEGLRERYEL